MQIRLGLHWPVEISRPDRGVGFLCTQPCFWAITPTAYRGMTGAAKSPIPKGASHESLRFPLFPPASQEARDSPARGDHDQEVPPLRRRIRDAFANPETLRRMSDCRVRGETHEAQRAAEGPSGRPPYVPVEGRELGSGPLRTQRRAPGFGSDTKSRRIEKASEPATPLV